MLSHAPAEFKMGCDISATFVNRSSILLPSYQVHAFVKANKKSSSRAYSVLESGSHCPCQTLGLLGGQVYELDPHA